MVTVGCVGITVVGRVVSRHEEDTTTRSASSPTRYTDVFVIEFPYARSDTQGATAATRRMAPAPSACQIAEVREAQ